MVKASFSPPPSLFLHHTSGAQQVAVTSEKFQANLSHVYK